MTRDLVMAHLALVGALLALGCSPEISADPQVPFDGAADLQVLGVAKTAGLHSVDLDKDGRADLVALSGGTFKLTVFLGTSDYTKAGELEAGASASGFATGDFNMDGELDLAVVHHDTDEVWLFFGKGAGVFERPRQVRVPVTKAHAHMLLVADANGDRIDDLLLAQADDNEAWVLIGDGKGGFAPSAGSPLATGNHPYVVAAADFNGDGHLDFTTPNWHGRSVSVFLGDGKGGFREGPNSPIGGFTAPTAIAAGDLTGDGMLDLALGNDDSNKVQILAGDGKGAFTARTVPDLVARGDCFAPILADLNGDGKTDVIATAVNGAPTFSYWINQGGGKFSAAHSLSCPAVASRICVADMNGDKVPDLVVGTWDEAKTLVWYGKARRQ